ncbi:ATP-grasp domain-containing protein [Nocardia sp. NPDC060256]|uniref:ATP-grasp domain-containing protein n=1 Tax=unclassified Nocardia TaxID=2637762 RepID=UPI0036638383
MRVLLFSVNPTVLEAMNEFLPPGSVVVLEEPGVLAARECVLHRRTGQVGGLSGPNGDYRCVEKVVCADYIQSEEFLEVALAEHARCPFTAVLPGGEYTVPAAALLAERLGLPGAGASVAPIFRDKILLRQAVDRAGLPSPRWAEVHGVRDVARFAAEVAGDFVLKPADRAGSHGVQLLDQDSDLEQAWVHALGDDSDPLIPTRPLHRRFLVEQRMRGPEYTVGLLVRDGAVVFHKIGETLLYPGAYPLERGHTIPAPITEEIQAELLSAMRHLVDSTGLRTAIMTSDWIRTEAGPVVVDCAARPPGARFMFLIGLVYGVDITKALVSVLSGEPVSVSSRPMGAAAIRFCSGPPGVVTEISGVAEARRVAGVVGVAVETRVGDVMEPLTSALARKAHVIAVGENPAAAAKAADRGAAMVRIHTRPAANPLI